MTAEVRRLSPDTARAGAATVPVAPADDRLEVRRDRLLHNWRDARARAREYLRVLGIDAADGEAFALEAVERAIGSEWGEGEDAVSATLRALRRVIVDRAGGSRTVGGAPRAAAESLERRFLRWRVDRVAASGPDAARTTSLDTRPWDGERLRATPPISRRSMVSEPIERHLLGSLAARRRRRLPTSEPALWGRPLRELRRGLDWTRAAHRRRFVLCLLVLLPTLIASGFMVNVLPHHARTWLEVAIVVFFGSLFGWISIGFWTAMFGFWTLLRGDRFAITRLAGASAPATDPQAPPPVAVVMPICDEPVGRTFAGLRAIHASLERTGQLSRFHFFVLSDTGDPGTAVEEEQAWFDWCRATGGFGRIFYRRRKVRVERKSGNVADFCRRWGTSYRYMIVLDADSVMAGESLVRMVDLMESHAHVGMIQTAPTAANRRTLNARVQQFASRVYGPMFAAGLHFWQLGDGQYWGHNAIIRIQAFMDHCALPRLPGREPLGGEILSHDFVEAALLGRAGWSIWLAYDLPGSYEEVPSALLDEMKRDRRWCQGNLQHLRLLFIEGLFGAHRMLFLNGALSYVSALLWFSFLGLSTVEAILEVLLPPQYFPNGPSLFPEWPIWRPDWALSLMAVIGMILFLPKLLSAFLIIVKQRRAREYGGAPALVASILLEILLSSLFAPIRMVFHSRFVVMNLLGRTVSWRSQGREDAETSWREALRHHGVDSLVASVWGVALYSLNPGYFWWVTPIIAALILSVPVSVLTSRVRWGDLALRLRLFVIPEESARPPELRDLDDFRHAHDERLAALPPERRDGFVRAALDPDVNAIHRAFLGEPRCYRPSIQASRQALVDRAVRDGLGALARRERRVLLMDPEMTDELHLRCWASGVVGRGGGEVGASRTTLEHGA